MNSHRANLFVALSHYDSSAEENYLTEAFAYLVKILCERKPVDALTLINLITGTLPVHPISNIQILKVETQRDFGKYGIVDMVIEEDDDTVIFIEIKHDSPLGQNQLESYFQALEELRKPNYRLVLLKRYKDVSESIGLDKSQYHLITWYEIHKWLHSIIKDDEVMTYIINEFQTFLEEKDMKQKRVSWEYIQGIPALLDFRNLLEVVKNEVMPTKHLKRTQGWSRVGLYIDRHYFFGVRYAKPLTLVYENNFGNYPTSTASMNLEDKHFFSLNADEQLNVLVDFLKSASKEVTRGKTDSVPPEKESID